jgi:hypothetical protein
MRVTLIIQFEKLDRAAKVARALRLLRIPYEMSAEIIQSGPVSGWSTHTATGRARVRIGRLKNGDRWQLSTDSANTW